MNMFFSLIERGEPWLPTSRRNMLNDALKKIAFEKCPNFANLYFYISFLHKNWLQYSQLELAFSFVEFFDICTH